MSQEFWNPILQQLGQNNQKTGRNLQLPYNCCKTIWLPNEYTHVAQMKSLKYEERICKFGISKNILKKIQSGSILHESEN